jgi:PAS domain S-box-containing protein
MSIRNAIPPKLVRYGGAVALVALAAVARAFLDPVFGTRKPLVCFLAAIMFSALACGAGPTVLAVFLSVSAAKFLFIEPRYALFPILPAEQVGLSIFLVVGLVAALFGELLHRARERDKWREIQRQGEQALLASERRFRQLADAMPQMVWTIGRDGNADYFNKRWYEYTGLPTDASGDLAWTPAFHPDDVERTKAAWQDAVTDGRPYEIEHRIKDCRSGKYRWHLGRAMPARNELGQITQWFGTSTDIDDLKQVERALQEARAEEEQRVRERTLELTQANLSLSREVEDRRAAEAKLREHAEEIETLMAVLPVPIWIARDPECRHMTGNLATYELTRLPVAAHLVKTPFTEEIPTTFRACRNGREVAAEELPMRQAAATGQDVRHAEFDLVFADGSVRSVYGFAAPLFGPGGRVRGCVGAFIDITERKLLENQLRESEERFQAFMDHLPAGAWILDDQGLFLFVNHFFSALTGVAHAALLGKTAYDLYPPAIAAQRKSIDRLVIQTGKALELAEAYVRPDGTPGELFVVKFPIRERDQCPRIGGVAIDVTERKLAEDRMRHLAAQLANAEDRERLRLATDLHDSIGQSLSLLKLKLQPLSQQHAADSEEALAFNTAVALLDDIIKQTRTLMFDLYPSMLHDLGLVPTLLWYSEQVSAQAQVSVSEIGTKQTLAIPLVSYLFRAIKELAGNAIRHGQARTIVVAVHWRPQTLRVVIDDDGAGFDPDTVLAPKTQRGLGLAGIKERLLSFSGTMFVESIAGQGARIALEVPTGGAADAHQSPPALPVQPSCQPQPSESGPTP